MPARKGRDRKQVRRKRRRRRGRKGVRITFLGAAREVTGSSYLVETAGVRFLMDCGMVQGGPEARARNARPFSFDPAGLGFVLLSHAHIDHCGLLPRLPPQGFQGPIYTTPATVDLLEAVLRDSAQLQEQDPDREMEETAEAKGANSKARPLYTLDDVAATLARARPVPYDETFEPAPGVRVRFRDAGHILGSSIVELWFAAERRTTKLVFSGDLGQPGRPILRDPTSIDGADALILESTYGNRNHKDLATTLEEFVAAVNDTLERKKGNVIIPSFAVGRAQELLYYFRDLTRKGLFRDLRIYVDSPMAAEATQITLSHFQLFNQEAIKAMFEDDHTGPAPKLRFVDSHRESRALAETRSGAVIIAGSGMCEGGRVRHHLYHNLPRPECTVLITGFQAAGTLGRQLVDGAKTVRLFGEEVPVRAQIYTLGGLSAHADRRAILKWVRSFQRRPRKIFAVHGEIRAARSLIRALSRNLGIPAHAPKLGETVRL